MKRLSYLIIALVAVVAANMLAWLLPCRWDMTDDKRYSLQPATLAVLDEVGDVTVVNYLTGDLNSGFTRLSRAVEAMAEEMDARYRAGDVSDPKLSGVEPVVIHERTRNGKSAQTEVYPYVLINDTLVHLLTNIRGLSGEENLNRSIENLEYALMSALFESHNRAADTMSGEREVMVVTQETEDSEENRREVDEHLMAGGSVLWAIDGLRESKWLDQLYHYGVRVERGWVEDRQCAQYPYCYTPLLLTNGESPLTRNLGQVSSLAPSPITAVGEDDGIEKVVLLASSTASRVGFLPDMPKPVTEEEWESFRYSYIPVAMSLEGEFPSAFRYLGASRNTSLPARQVVIGSSSVLQDGLPGMSNRAFLTHTMQWLSGQDALLRLREKTVALRLLNDERAYRFRTQIMVLSVAIPLLLIAVLGLICNLIHKKRYIL